MSDAALPSAIDDEAHLEELLARPSPADVASSARGVPLAGAAAQLSAEPTGTAAEIEGWGATGTGAGVGVGTGVGVGAGGGGTAGSEPATVVAVASRATKEGARNFTRQGFDPPSETT